MSDTIRQPLHQPGTTTTNEATFLGGILRKGEIVGGWEIESKIPVTSGEAELYLAKKDGQTGVIKYYRSPDFKPKDEIVTTLLSWKHEDVIQLLDTGRHNGLFFEAMEYAAGGAIDSRDPNGYRYLPLSEDETVEMVREVSNAFHACHAVGIIHRDIKPANIFYRNADGTDFVIGDFGISSQLDMEARLSSRLTQNLNRTEGYAAPEVYSGVIKSPVDYYALGITGWEVLTGKVAFEGRNPNHVSRDTIEGRIIEDLLSRDESASLSERMKTLLRGLLTHQHDKRWGHAEVQDWLAGKDVPVYSQRPETRVTPYKFEGQELTSLAKVAEALVASPEAGKKHLYRGLIEGWLAAFDQDLAMKVGDIKEGLGETAKDKALRQVALLLNPGLPFVTAGGKSIESFFGFAKLIESEPEELVEHLRDPEDGLWDFFELWGAGAVIEALKPMLSSVKSQKRMVNMMVVALKVNVIMPFEGTRFAGTELSTLGQLETLPKECQKRFMMELEDQNGLLAVWLEAVSGRAYPKEWGKEGLPEWKEMVGYWNGTYEIERAPESNKSSATAPVALNKGDMILVQGGTFKMGDTFGDDENNDEKPIHEVTLSDYYIGKYEVTFEEYDKYCDENGKEKPPDAEDFEDDEEGNDDEEETGWGRERRPVINISWFDAVEYCNWRSKKEGLKPAYTGSGETIECDWSSNGFRLPTEAEWEYAARGGQESKGYKYAGSDNVDKVAWHAENSEGMTHPVGEKMANELGVCDMSGNVWEWCWDRYGDYSEGEQADPRGAASGSRRVERGGSWDDDATDARLANRYCYDPSYGDYDLGFRLARPSSP